MGPASRSKIVFDIYVAQLYLEHPAATAREVISADGRKRMVMHFLYDKVEKKSSPTAGMRVSPATAVLNS